MPGRVRTPRRPGILQLSLVCLLVPALLAGSGCHRRFYRKWTDKSVDSLLLQKADDPRWALMDYHVYPDGRARFADITNPDRPPMPPDDPGAKELSPNPQRPGKAGVALVEGVGYLQMLDAWDRENRADLARQEAEQKQKNAPAESKPGAGPTGKPEGSGKPGDRPARDEKAGAGGKDPLEDVQPSAEEVLTMAERMARRPLADVCTTTGMLSQKDIERAISCERTYLIKLEQAVELGLVNSREYQTRREQLYLAALPVTLERFAFTPQLFWVEEAFRERFGRESPGGYVNRWRVNSTAGLSQAFSTGALLLLSFANRTIYNLGNEPSSSVSQITLDFIQPLLRGAGRAVTLEPLTQAERNLLYVLRDFARFRQEFFVFIASGQPTFIPGVQAGVQALSSGTTSLPGIFVPSAAAFEFPITGVLVGPQVVPGDSRQLSFNTGPNAPPQGFLSTLTSKAQLINSYRNIERLQRYLRRFRVYLEGGIVNSVQVGQVEQQLLRSVENVLRDQASYRNDVDQFKLQLGLPMNIAIEVDDGPLRSLYNLTERYEDVIAESEKLGNQIQDFGRTVPVAELRRRLRSMLTGSQLVRGTQFAKTISERIAEWEKLPVRAVRPGDDTLETRLERLRKQRDKLREQRDLERSRMPAAATRELARLEFDVDMGAYELALRVYERKPWEAIKDDFLRSEGQRYRFNAIYRTFLSVVEAAIVERNRAVAKMWPALPPLCVDGVDLLSEEDDRVIAAVSQAALANRLDLMNQRAQLVDSWRKITVAANALMGTLNVEYRMDAFSKLGALQPFSFAGKRTQHRLIFFGEAPLVRMEERNNYRAALIAYQHQRRQLQLAEDQVLFAVRLDLRGLRAVANNYHKVQKRAVELAYQQVDQALQAFSQPQIPPGPAQPAGLVGPPTAGGGAGDPAALTQQLLQAQNSLLNAQNDLYNTWIGYITTRMSLYRDMGLMPLDPRGVWIDDVATCLCPPHGPTNGTTNDGQDGYGAGEGAGTPTDPDTGKTDSGKAVEQLPAPRILPPIR